MKQVTRLSAARVPTGPCPAALGMAKSGARRWATRADLFQRVSQAIDEIRRHPEEDHSLERLSYRACLSKHHFAREFRTIAGLPPGRFRRLEQLLKARTLIRDSGLSMAEIADECGFESAAGFSRAFRRLFLLSPQAARARFLASSAKRRTRRISDSRRGITL